MSYKPGDTYYGLLALSNPTTGAAQNADSGGGPTATAVHNGADDVAFALTVTNLALGQYKVTGAIPNTYVKGDAIQISAAATVNSVAGVGVIDSFVLDSKRVGDLNDIAASAIVSSGPITTSSGAILTVTNLTNAPTTGDFTTTMKASLNAATPASVVGAVGSVTGNVGGDVIGSVGSINGVTFPAHFSVLAIDPSGYITFNNAGTATAANQTTILTDIGNLITTVGVAGAGLTAIPSGSTSTIATAVAGKFLFDGSGNVKSAPQTAVTLPNPAPAGYGPPGNGIRTVDQDYGSTGALAYKTSGGQGIDGAIVTAYVASEWTANAATAVVRGQTTTVASGAWANPMQLDPATYTFVFVKLGVYGPDMVTIPVS